MPTHTVGTLQCTILDPPGGAKPRQIVMLSHGFGAPGTDLVPLAGELVRSHPELAAETRFVFPMAPLTMDAMGLPGGRAWWMIDLDARIAAMQKGDMDVLRRDHPDGMDVASDALLEVVKITLEETGLPASRLIIGGFSQGSMVSTEVALRMEDAPAGLVIFSGTLLCEDRWKEMAARRGTMPILQTHGHQDPILPFVCAEWLRDVLTDAGLTVDFRDFPGVHQIPMVALSGLSDLLKNLAETDV